MNWEQLQTILWLRWRLTRNQFVRGGQVNAVLAILGIVVLAVRGYWRGRGRRGRGPVRRAGKRRRRSC